MHIILLTILFTHCLQTNKILHTLAFKLNSDKLMRWGNVELLEELMRNSATKSANWPLQAGYPGLSVNNLNEYVSLLSHCLVNIQNFQGIDIIGIKSPVYIPRFDVAFVEVCDDSDSAEDDEPDDETRRFFFGRIPPKSKRNCTTNYYQAIKNTDKSFKARWYCTAQFDLFFPEPTEAPHIVHHSQNSHLNSEDRSLFDISLEYSTTLEKQREGWSKTL